jgi:hypothetical protein
MKEVNYKNIKDEEILSPEDASLCAALKDLKRVAAPADFDFRLLARLRRSAPQQSRARGFSPALRYALPLCLVVLISAFTVFNSFYFNGNEKSAPLAENQFPKVQTEKANIANNTPNDAKEDSREVLSASSNAPQNEARAQRTTTNPALTAAAKPGVRRSPKISSPENASEPQAASRTTAVHDAETFTPPGINPNRAVNSSPNAGNPRPLGAGEVLAQLGIEAVFANDAWRVKTVARNSLAERSGVRTGDAVEAIDGERLTEKPLKRQTIEGKKLTVARGAEKLEIALTNQ